MLTRYRRRSGFNERSRIQSWNYTRFYSVDIVALMTMQLLKRTIRKNSKNKKKYNFNIRLLYSSARRAWNEMLLKQKNQYSTGIYVNTLRRSRSCHFQIIFRFPIKCQSLKDKYCWYHMIKQGSSFKFVISTNRVKPK